MGERDSPPTGEARARCIAGESGAAAARLSLRGDLSRLFGLGDGSAWIERAAMAALGDPGVDVGSLGSYEAVEEIGRGGQGTVYRARQPVTGRTVAIKRVGTLSDARAAARFEREVEAATRLSHPNVVTVHGAEVVDGHAVIVMEYVDGSPIGAWARGVRDADGPVAWQTILRACVEVCAGVGHAHQRGVIHRDIKPSNVLVGKDGRPRLLDFGIARVAGDDRPATQTEFAGTPQFSSPEQIAGLPVDVRTDVYSLGVLIYELLTGEQAFAHASGLAALVDAIRRGLDTRVSRRVRGVPRDMDWVLARATATDPAARYGSVDALASDLRGILGGLAVTAHPPSVLYAARKAARRHWIAMSMTSIVTVSLVITTWVTWRSSQRVGAALLEAREALSREQRALEAASNERDVQTELSDFLLEILRAGNPTAIHSGRSMREAIEFVASDTLSTSRQLRPEVEAAFCKAIGDIYQGMGLLEPATYYLTRAIDQYTRLYGADSTRLIDPMLKLSRVLRDQGQYERALEIQERLVAFRRVDSSITGAPYIAQALNSLGITQRRLGLTTQAERSLIEARDLYTRSVGGGNENVALTCGALSGVYIDMGRFEDAEREARRATAIIDAYYPSQNHVDSAAMRRNLGAALAAGGRFDEAEMLLRRSIEIYQSIPDAAIAESARSRMELGRLLVRTNRRDEGVAQMREALAGFETAYAPGNPRILEAQQAIEQALAAPIEQGAIPSESSQTHADESPSSRHGRPPAP